MSKSTIVLLTVLIAFVATASAQNSTETNPLNNAIERSSEVKASVFVRPRVALDASLKAEGNAAVISLAERQTFDLINKQRLDAGIEQLVWSEDLAAVARQHSLNMAEYKFFSHRGQNGATVDERADKFGVRDWRAIGENIAFLRGYSDPPEFAVSRWMQSTSHRQNLLDKRWKESGIGVAILPDGTYYFTQVFLLRN